MSVASDLNDSCFSLATDLLVELCQAVEEETGEKPTIADLCELLTWGLRSCDVDILADVNSLNVRIHAKVKKRGKVALQPGDLLAVPSKKKGEYYRVLYITNNRFGWAFGVFLGKHQLKPPPPSWKADVFPYPFYAHHEYVVSGRWQVLGNYAQLLALFPTDPPLYYSKKNWPNDDRIGPYGSSESPSTEALKHVSKEEAEAVGLLNNKFLQSMLANQFEEFLARLLNGTAKRQRGK